MSHLSPITAEPLWAHPSDNRIYYIDLTRCLSVGVETTITSVTSVAEVTTSALTITGTAVVTSELELSNGDRIRPRKAVKCQVTGGVSGTDYTLAVTVVQSDGGTLVRNVMLKVSST